MVTILRGTTLSAIVRDELMNPAGGIADFVESIVPFVKHAKIVDTGSKDGTREYLAEAARQYTNLEVLDHPFDGYGPSRNFSMHGVKGWILILDADERLRKQDLPLLEKKKEIRDLACLTFSFMEIKGKNQEIVHSGLRERFLHTDLWPNFVGKVWEGLSFGGNGGRYDFQDAPILIYHFAPLKRFVNKKKQEWYGPVNERPAAELISKAPSDCSSFPEWKRYNPARELYR